jgi:exopolysaccharide production protein ExoY
MKTTEILINEQSTSSYLQKQCPQKSSMSKRVFDIFFSTLILATISPICIILAVIVKCSSKGPIFYASKRVGISGKIIHCWKFRTMYVDADKKLKDLLSSSNELKREWQEHFKLRNDPRITKIGAFLRKTSLDELPQFWNVLKGDLSTVGPRPLSLDEVHIVIEKGREKMFCVRPGITGLWQTSGRNLIPFDTRIVIEESYVDKQSLWFDLQLIFKTIPMILFPRGAF